MVTAVVSMSVSVTVEVQVDGEMSISQFHEKASLEATRAVQQSRSTDVKINRILEIENVIARSQNRQWTPGAGS